MSYDIIVQTALERQEAFRSLTKHLKTIKQTARKLDSKAETYLFGSVAEKKHNYSSDIDILIVTKLRPERVLAELWNAGIEEPFEVHVHTTKEAEFFKKTATLTRI
jgi:predicted nucleotidyltransferase